MLFGPSFSCQGSTPLPPLRRLSPMRRTETGRTLDAGGFIDPLIFDDLDFRTCFSMCSPVLPNFAMSIYVLFFEKCHLLQRC